MAAYRPYRGRPRRQWLWGILAVIAAAALAYFLVDYLNGGWTYILISQLF